MRSTLRWRVFARAAVTSIAPSVDDSAEFRAAVTYGVGPGFDKTDSHGGRRGRAACLGGHGLPPLVDAARAGPHAGRDAAERTGHLRRTGRRLLPRRRWRARPYPGRDTRRNTWMVWSAGNDHLWDWLARESAGAFDLLKIVGSYDPEEDPAATPGQREKLKQPYGFRRENRMARLGLINEPCFEQPKDGDARRYGLLLDQRQLACAPDPFENGEKYPGVPAGARGPNTPLGDPYRCGRRAWGRTRWTRWAYWAR